MRGFASRIKILVVAFVIAFGFIVNPLPVFSDNQQQIKVGYSTNYGVIMDGGSNRSAIGYGYDFLTEIAKYTGWKYEFINVDWDEGMDLLAAGEIDIMGPLQKTDERDKIFDFPDYDIGVEYGALYISDTNMGTYYDDIQAFDGMRIGSFANNYFIEPFWGYCRQNNIKTEIVYTDIEKLGEGLAQGDYDAFLSGSLMDIPNTHVVSKFSTAPYYFATTNGNTEVLDGLNKALENIYRDDVYFSAKLDEKYYGEKSISAPAFTREEAEYIKKTPELRVACNPNWAPLESFNKVTGEFEGINIDVMREISAHCGIKFTLLETKDYNESLALLESGGADLILGHTQLSASSVVFSDTIYDVPLVIVGLNSVNMDDNPVVALANLKTSTSMAAMAAYPNFTYLECDGSVSALAALKSGESDLSFINTYAFDYLARNRSNGQYVTVPTDISYPVRIGVSNRLDPAAVAVINKAIGRIPADKLSSVIFANTINTRSDVALSRIVQDNSVTIICLLVVIFGLFFITILLVNKKAQHKLKKLAYVDSLTGVATLAKFELSVTEVLKNSRRGAFYITTLDINNFKYINDSFGYDVGDMLLAEITEHFKHSLSPGEIIGRTGADNFVFLTFAGSKSYIKRRFRELTDVDYHIQKILPELYSLVFSAGTYLITDPTVDVSTLIDRANLARKTTKNNHTTSLAEYTSEMDLQHEWKKEVTLYMKGALDGGEYIVYLQPKFRFNDEKVVGAEALVRWRHPTRGLLAPDMFIPIFEQNGFIQKLDMYMFEQVCIALHTWEQQKIKLDGITISVNLSRLHLFNPFLTENLVAIVEKHAVDPSHIELELTESIVFNNKISLIDSLLALRAAGFKISIDDFGSGYSSLNMLKDLPVDVLKIDKAFLDESSDSGGGRMIIAKVIELAKSLNLTTVAEGVETKEQVTMLLGMGCDIAQGYYYARPMPLEEFVPLLTENK